MIKVQYKLLHPLAQVPTKTPGNAGYDLYAVERVVVPPRRRRVIKTGIASAIEPGYYGHISDRSGVAYKDGGHCLGKIIDDIYRKEWGIILFNTDEEKEIVVEIGDRPAQVIFHKYFEVESQVVDELPASDRGAGFGSSGK